MKRQRESASFVDVDAILDPVVDAFVDESDEDGREDHEDNRCGVDWDEDDSTSVVDSRATDAFDGMSISSRSTKSNEAGNEKSKESKSAGKFKHLIKIEKVEQNGRIRTIAQGMDMKRVPMNNERMEKVRRMMALHNNFTSAELMNNVQAMVDHFTCLMIMREAYTRNGQGKADKYPRYLRIFIGPSGCFSKHSDIKRENCKEAREFAFRYVKEVTIHTQNIKINGCKVPAMQAPEKKRNALINKLVGNYLHGFDDYVDLLEDLDSGKISLPQPIAIPSTPSGLSLSSFGSPPMIRERDSSSEEPKKKKQFVGDPNSPCAALLQSDDEE